MLSGLHAKLAPLLVDKTARRLLISSVVLNVVAWALILVRVIPAVRRGAMIALHYNVYLNVNSVGSAYWALLPAAIGTVMMALNAWLAARSYGPNRLNALVFLAVTVFYELLLLAAAAFIVFVNLTR